MRNKARKPITVTFPVEAHFSFGSESEMLSFLNQNVDGLIDCEIIAARTKKSAAAARKVAFKLAMNWV